MLILGIDTSTKIMGAGLWDENGFVAEISGRAHLEHSERVLMHVRTLFEVGGRRLDELTGVGAVVGPGSFTGLRVGIATAQGLAESQGVPAVGLSSLRVLAHGIGGNLEDWLICPLLVARKGYVYAALYREQGGEMAEIRPPITCEPDEIVSWVEKPTVFVGRGFIENRQFLRDILGDRVCEPPPPFHKASGRVVSYLAYRDLLSGRGCDPALLLPEYLGPSTAEINWRKRRVESKNE